MDAVGSFHGLHTLDDSRYELGLRYMCCVSMTVLIYDFLCTIKLEVQHIWPSKWTITKLLYLTARYAPFIDLPMTLYFYMAPNTSIPECHKIHMTLVWLTGIGVGAAQGILAVRTIALYDNSRRLMLYIGLSLLAVYSPLSVLLVLWACSVSFGPPAPGTGGCHLTDGNSIILATYGAIAFTETVLTGLSIWIGVKKYRTTGGHVITTFYRDGIFFYIYLLLLSCTNIAMSSSGPSTDLLASFQRVMHAVLSARLVLHLREAACEPSQALSRITSIRFGHRTAREPACEPSQALSRISSIRFSHQNREPAFEYP
ncbi:hypothetical protein B0H34DRAFT_732664 [Crassisporium funariophilum]|nr:hypothetical protein B0H34DRAFT_732664 [Crassisporium funariophilum]